MKKKLFLSLGLIFWTVLAHSAQAFDSVGRSPIIPIEVLENQSSVRVSFRRDQGPKVSQLEEFAYTTRDSTARAGVDYIAASGTLTFLPGQVEASIEVSILDNGTPDGPRAFSIELDATPRDPASTPSDRYPLSRTVVILDNEFPLTAVDPTYVPDARPGSSPFFPHGSIWPMPDGRVLLAGGARGMTLLDTRGRNDPTFQPLGSAVARLEPIHVLANGAILARESSPSQDRYVRLRQDGSLAGVMAARPEMTQDKLDGRGHQTQGYQLAIPFPDGSLLAYSFDSDRGWRRLRRLLEDGTPDLRFTAPEAHDVRALATAPDGRSYVEFIDPIEPDGFEYRLKRLNPDGSVDDTFLPSFDPYPLYRIDALLVRRSGKIIVSGYFGGITETSRSLVQLDSNGKLDPAFDLGPGSWSTIAPLELPDGRLLVFGEATPWTPWHVVIYRLGNDGALDHTVPGGIVATFVPYPSVSPLSAMLDSSGRLLVKGTFSQVDGLPRRGLVRLNPTLPQPEFRVLATEFDQSGGVARVKIVRTGSTSGTAQVGYLTRDGTARSGRDFQSQSGTLSFRPLESSREILIPLGEAPASAERLEFILQLHSPSDGFSVVPATSLSILPGVRITGIAQQRVNGFNQLQLTITGIVPGIPYELAASRVVTSRSKDPINWMQLFNLDSHSFIADGSSFTLHQASTAEATFYSVRRPY